ncbi:PREDICTED: uncharacterized protein LOC109463659 [Branchiostoma belcheri]|uniref:Uncharacterized protein LOC109463659 n=1 Tax=Branchiostoma belcheri TaxID=7741 RepID=A0A6P4YGD3_BRABE|nr:PREDICTED: uncharacterized protein LOC109463659 [Branchiostoma belcheri]
MEAVVHLYLFGLVYSACALPDLAAATPVPRALDLADSTTATPGIRLLDPTDATPVPRLAESTDVTPVPHAPDLRDPTKGATPVPYLPDPTVGNATPVPRLADSTNITPVPQAPDLRDPTYATPVPRVPDPGFQTTLVQALSADIRGTNWTLALTEETIRAMREVHFGDPNYTPALELPAWGNGTVTADDVQTGRLEDSEILDRLSSQLYIYEREISAVMQDELAMVNSDAPEGGVVFKGDVVYEEGARRVYQLVVQVYGKTVYLRALLAQTAHLMGHDLQSDHAGNHYPSQPASEYEMQRRVFRVFLAYRAFLGDLRGVFAALLRRELATTARLGSPTSATPGNVTA